MRPAALVRLPLAGLVLVALAIVPFVVTDYFLAAVAIKALWLGIAAASLVFLAAYGGMVSLAQTALYGVCGYTVAVLVTSHGWNGWLAIAAGIVVTAATGAVFGAVASRSSGIYFLMITFSYAVIALYFFQQVSAFGGHGGINDVTLPAALGDVYAHRERMYYVTLAAAVLVLVAIRYLVRTPFGLGLQGLRDDAVRLRAVGFDVRLHRTMAITLGALFAAVAGVFSVAYEGRISPGSLDLTRTIDLLTIAVVGGLFRIEGAWLGALVFVAADTYVRGFSERFDTWIGILFLLIVLLFPGGLAGAAAALGRRLRGPGTRRLRAATAGPANAASVEAGTKGGGD